MIAVYSVVDVCASKDLVYHDKEAGILKKAISKYIETTKISKDQVNDIWTGVQERLTATPVMDSDCAAVGNDIISVFGSDIFEGTVKASPF